MHTVAIAANMTNLSDRRTMLRRAMHVPADSLGITCHRRFARYRFESLQTDPFGP